MCKLAIFDSDGWELDDGEALHAEAPVTFWIPDRTSRESVPPGHLVKLVFRMRGSAPDEDVSVERMWVQVVERSHAQYRGLLDNDPFASEVLKSGDEVYFEPRHIIQIWTDS